MQESEGKREGGPTKPHKGNIFGHRQVVSWKEGGCTADAGGLRYAEKKSSAMEWSIGLTKETFFRG